MVYAALPERRAGRAHEDAGEEQLHRLATRSSYILQHRFEEDGWYKVIELMKNVKRVGRERRA